MPQVTVYLDVSCLSRPYDDQWQERVRLEAEAVLLILQRCDAGEWRQVSSEMAAIEISANPDPEKRRKTRALLPDRRDIIALEEPVLLRAEELEQLGLHGPDAAHVAAAESLQADVLLSCDDRLVRAARRLRLSVRLENPLVWLQERQDEENA